MATSGMANGDEENAKGTNKHQRNKALTIGGLAVLVFLVSIFVIAGIASSWMESSRREETEQSDAKASADRDKIRGQIERRSRMDALDVMKQHQRTTISDFTVKEVTVSYLGDQVRTMGSPKDNGYKADIIVSTKSTLGFVTTYRLKLHYDTEGEFMPEYSEASNIGN